MMRTRADCKRLISRVGLDLGVSPMAISLRLLSHQDKRGLLSGEVTEDCLRAHVQLWIANGKPDYVNCLENKTEEQKQ